MDVVSCTCPVSLSSLLTLSVIQKNVEEILTTVATAQDSETLRNVSAPVNPLKA